RIRAACAGRRRHERYVVGGIRGESMTREAGRGKREAGAAKERSVTASRSCPSRSPLPSSRFTLPAYMFNKVLIGNRGEVGLRGIRGCRELGVQTVAVYSEADRESLHVRFADDDVCIGPAPARESYLNIPRLIAAAEITGADAIHPGYGFLAE